MKYLFALVFVLVVIGAVIAQETPTPTFTIPASPHVFATTTAGQMTRFDYVSTAGSVQIANLILMILVSLWGFFLFGTFIVWRDRGRK